MSIRLSDYAIDEEEWSATVDEESEWLPNPYQAEAEAQVRAGAWPGASLLMCARPYRRAPREATEPAPDDGPLWSMKSDTIRGLGRAGRAGDDVVREQPDEQSDDGGDGEAAEPEDAQTWSGPPWRFLFEFRNADRTTTTAKQGGADFDSTDEGDVDADLPETPGSTTEATEGDDSGTPCSASRCSSVARLSRKISHQCVPRTTDLSLFASGNKLDANVTTLMIRNIPNLYTRSMLMEELESLGLSHSRDYDFIYLPIDTSTQWNVGYAFVNCVNNEIARRCVEVMTDYTFCCFEHGSSKVAQVSTAHIQGLERNLAYYSNTAVQCARIQSHRPLVLASKQNREDAPGGSKSSSRRRRRPRPKAVTPEEEATPLDPGLLRSSAPATAVQAAASSGAA